MSGFNHFAVIVSALIFFAIGAGWYNVFATAWLAGIGKTMEDMTRQGGGSALPFVVGFVAILVMCYTLAWLIGRLGAQSAAAGARTGAAVGIGFIAAMLALNYGFEARSITLWLINSGYALVGLVIAGAIIGGWRRKTLVTSVT